jgi:hypothetical protein
VCGSRLAVDRFGRSIVILTSGAADVQAGHVYLVLLLERSSGRAPPARERQATYAPPSRRARERERQAQLDDELDEQAALAWVLQEQRRNPPDVFAAA